MSFQVVSYIHRVWSLPIFAAVNSSDSETCLTARGEFRGFEICKRPTTAKDIAKDVVIYQERKFGIEDDPIPS